MGATKKNGTTTRNAVLVLRRENAALRKKLRKAEEDSEAYRKAAQAYAIKLITPEQLKEWDREVEDSGQTILDVLREFKNGHRSNGRL